MKIALLAALAAMTFASNGAFAGEGGRPSSIALMPHSLSIAALPANEIVTGNGSEGGLQTANSLPLAFANRTPAFEQARSVAAYRQNHLGTSTVTHPLALQIAPAVPENG